VTQVSDFYDEDEVTKIYYPEIEALLYKEIPEAEKVVIFDHTRRATSDELRKTLKLRPQANGVHNDYTLNSGPKRVRDLFPENAEELLKKRFLIMNVWRPVRTVESFPLAFVNAQSVPFEDYLTLYRITKDRVGEIQQVKYNDKHEWHFFPKMERNEVAVFKTFDSLEQEGLSRFTPHTAVTVVNEPPKAPPRESIEIRALVFFK